MESENGCSAWTFASLKETPGDPKNQNSQPQGNIEYNGTRLAATVPVGLSYPQDQPDSTSLQVSYYGIIPMAWGRRV